MNTTQPPFLTVSSIDLLGNYEYEMKFSLCSWVPWRLFLGAFWNLRLEQSEENSKIKNK